MYVDRIIIIGGCTSKKVAVGVKHSRPGRPLVSSAIQPPSDPFKIAHHINHKVVCTGSPDRIYYTTGPGANPVRFACVVFSPHEVEDLIIQPTGPVSTWMSAISGNADEARDKFCDNVKRLCDLAPRIDPDNYLYWAPAAADFCYGFDNWYNRLLSTGTDQVSSPSSASAVLTCPECPHWGLMTGRCSKTGLERGSNDTCNLPK